MVDANPALVSALRAHPDAALLAGIDEAGLGPILGPLVVAGVAMEGPRGADPWQLLDRYVCRARGRAGKVQVADSKKVHQGKKGLQRLEATVLSFWSVLHGSFPATLGDLLAACGTDLLPLARCPWYHDLALPLPHTFSRDEIELFSHLLGGIMRDHLEFNLRRF